MLDWIGVAAVGILAGWFLRDRFRRGSAQRGQDGCAALRRNIDEAETRYLEVLRREISNILMNVDLDRMVSAYEKGWRYQDEVAQAGEERISADLKSLTLKHRFFADFDLLGTRHFIPYEDARSMLSDDDLVERYLEISKMILLNQLINQKQHDFKLFTEHEFEVLQKAVRRKRDRAFKDQIETAVDRYYAFHRAIDRYGSKEAQVESKSLDENDLEVFRLASNGPENELGIAFKGTDEYAVYGTFHDDDGKIFRSFSRSDPTFTKHDILDT